MIIYDYGLKYEYKTNMMHMKLFLKSPPITPRNGVLIAAPPLAEWLCVCCAQGGNHWPAHVSASLYRLGEYSGPR